MHLTCASIIGLGTLTRQSDTLVYCICTHLEVSSRKLRHRDDTEFSTAFSFQLRVHWYNVTSKNLSDDQVSSGRDAGPSVLRSFLYWLQTLNTLTGQTRERIFGILLRD